MVTRRGGTVDLIEATCRRWGSQVAGGGTMRAVDDHASGAGATLETAGTWAAPCRFCVAVHAGRIGVRVAAIAQVGVAG